MTARSPSWIAAHPVAAFVLLALGTTWSAWAPPVAASHGLLPEVPALYDALYIVGGVGPLAAAWAVLRAQDRATAGRRLFAPLGRWRVHPVWYLLVCLGPVLLTLAALSAAGRLGPEPGGPEVSWSWLLVLLIRLLAAVPEELAWRGFALPRLQTRCSALTAGLTIGVVWALWHLPLLLDRDNPMSTYPLGLYVVSVLAASVVYTWVFNSTGGSVLLVTILHGVGNAAADVLLGADPFLLGALQRVEATVLAALAAFLVLLLGPQHLSHRPHVPSESAEPGGAGRADA